MGQKRTYTEAMEDSSKQQRISPFMPMFEVFRAELDEHHDRRERIIKASRDITAASKKIIFSLQRMRKLGQPIPPNIKKANAQYWDTIEKTYAAVSKDLQGIDAYRYSRNITGGHQEFMESLSFQHYLETQSLISYDESCKKLAELGSEGGAILLTPEDYILGIFDMVGELMRFAITAMATSGGLPGGESRPQPAAKEQKDDAMDVDTPTQKPQRNVLEDMRELRTHLEGLDIGERKFSGDVDKKMGVMRTCVEKVESALYGLIIRGRERPKGWMPDLGGERRGREEVEGF
ncbi:putative translin-associated factor [Diplodia seriata]|uniref:Putative translin-associated factor n=1 Tax=Diplodia seriata TaxID=420778 RepID=A0A0G2GH17_9PEZI|nr:putative translin-associated factor [Diplodia seriata]